MLRLLRQIFRPRPQPTQPIRLSALLRPLPPVPSRPPLCQSLLICLRSQVQMLVSATPSLVVVALPVLTTPLLPARRLLPPARRQRPSILQSSSTILLVWTKMSLSLSPRRSTHHSLPTPPTPTRLPTTTSPHLAVSSSSQTRLELATVSFHSL